MFTIEAMIIPIKTPINAQPIVDKSFSYTTDDCDEEHQGTSDEALYTVAGIASVIKLR